MKTEYPFRFVGPKVGDKIWWNYLEVVDGVDTVSTSQATIVGVSDAYDWQVRGPEEKREDFVVFYDIDEYRPHSLVFGDELFLTEEEAIAARNEIVT